MINNNSTLYLSKKISTLVILSAIALLAINSLLLSFNVLLQPVQAQTTLGFGTESADGNVFVGSNSSEATLTFDAQGGDYSSDSQTGKITKGNIQIQFNNNNTSYSGTINDGTFYNYSSGTNAPPYIIFSATIDNFLNSNSYTIHADCSPWENILYGHILLYKGNSTEVADEVGIFQNSVFCPIGGGNTAQPPSSSSPSSLTGTRQDSDGDGIPDSSDRCTHNSNSRCFKEAGTSSGTTPVQQPSTSNGTGNQTR